MQRAQSSASSTGSRWTTRNSALGGGGARHHLLVASISSGPELSKPEALDHAEPPSGWPGYGGSRTHLVPCIPGKPDLCCLDCR